MMPPTTGTKVGLLPEQKSFRFAVHANASFSLVNVYHVHIDNISRNALI